MHSFLKCVIVMCFVVPIRVISHFDLLNIKQEKNKQNVKKYLC